MKNTYFLDMMRAQEKWRLEESINLLPSENMSSPQVRALMSSDFGHRYTLPVDGVSGGEFIENAYRGSKLTTQVERSAEEAARDLFKAKHACVQPIGGHIAAMIAILSMTKRGDTMCAIAPEHGGYDGYLQEYIPDIYGLRSFKLPFDSEKYNLDTDAAAAEIRSRKPRLVILGASFLLFPYDMKPVKEACADAGSVIAYDGSHVLGLIAGGEFQKPLKEGADILYGSTHKSFFGPQGGLILTDRDDMIASVRKNLTWRVVDNVHWNRVAALGQALLELKKFGPSYAKQIVRNSQRLGRELKERGVPVMFEEQGFSRSHQLLLDPKEIRAIYGVSMNDFSVRLEKSNIMIDSVSRVGTSEITRLGVKEKHLPELADLFALAAKGKDVRSRVRSYRNQFTMDYIFR
jgi:glycine hydroxymethyltransferase